MWGEYWRFQLCFPPPTWWIRSSLFTPLFIHSVCWNIPRCLSQTWLTLPSVWWNHYSSERSTSIIPFRISVRPRLTPCRSSAWSSWIWECTILQRPPWTLVRHVQGGQIASLTECWMQICVWPFLRCPCPSACFWDTPVWQPGPQEHARRHGVRV